MGMPIGGSSPTNPPNQTALMAAALMGGFAGRFGALASVSMEGALASLPAFGGLFSEVGEGAAGLSAGAAESGATGVSEGVAVDIGKVAGEGAGELSEISTEFFPAERTGLKFDEKISSNSSGNMEVELSSNQMFDESGNIVSRRYAESDLVARYSPDGDLRIDWYGTTVEVRGVGSEMISRAIETVGPDKVESVSAQLGKTNAEVFREAKNSGMTELQAVWETPLGKTMDSLGFKTVKVVGSSVRFSR
ncbi:hypothetical protein HX881_30945 [Pseudomonas gingeri]|uniref:hypothetical protein n=1 Tax=Pseudomonas gingeri TaxID=117681 RepID=UPI0015A26D7B|nr:hypothetical protein [Pseudomonas gingeri]NVZ30006.1 hypothetical protein [Pseudomonas gingeri]